MIGQASGSRAAARRGVAVAVVAALVLASGRASAGPVRPHPYFDDGGTLSWSTDLASAQAAAREAGRLIFVEYGRRPCCTCKVLVQKVLPSESVRGRVQGLFVGLAADCDEPEPKVRDIFVANLPGAFLLPLVAVLSPDLEWVTGWAGGKSAEEVAKHVDKAEAFQRRRTAVAAKPDPVPPEAVRGTGSVPAPKPEAAASRLPEAKRAASEGRWGTVLRLAREAGGGFDDAEAAEWRRLLVWADAWAETTLADAVAAAKAGRCAEAQRLLDDVEREMAGRWAADDAGVGKRALRQCESLKTTASDARANALRTAATEYAGTRWAVLFAA